MALARPRRFLSHEASLCRAMKRKLVCPQEEQVHKVERTYSFDGDVPARRRYSFASDVPDFQMPASPPKKQRSAASATVQIGMQHFSNNSELCSLPGAKDKVVVIMMEHNA